MSLITVNQKIRDFTDEKTKFSMFPFLDASNHFWTPETFLDAHKPIGRLKSFLDASKLMGRLKYTSTKKVNQMSEILFNE